MQTEAKRRARGGKWIEKGRDTSTGKLRHPLEAEVKKIHMDKYKDWK